MNILTGSGGLGSGKAPTVSPDSLFSEDTIELTLGVVQGPVAGLFNGAKTFYLDDTPLVSAGGVNNFTPFQLDSYHGDPAASVIKNSLGGQSASTPVNVALVQNVAVTRTTAASLSNIIDALEVRINFNALVNATTGGDQLEETAVFKIEYSVSGTGVWLPFFTSATISITGKTSGGYVKEFRKPVTRQAANWDIRVTQISSDTDTVHVVHLSWESFQCVNANSRAYNNLAVVKGTAKASDQFSALPTFSGVWSGFIIKAPNNYNPLSRFYNGTWSGTFRTTHTDNPAWCLYDIVTHPDHGLAQYLPNIQVDKYSVYDAGVWCDGFVPRGSSGTYQPRWTYNDEITEGRNGLEWARYVAASFGGIFVSDLNQTLRIKLDAPGTIAQIYGAESVDPTKFNYSISDVTTRPNDITVSFINPELGWVTDVRRVYDNALIARNGRIPMDFVAVGCIDAYEAQRRAYNMLNKANTECITVTFNTARQGMHLEVYDLIGIADSDMGWGLSGRIKSQAGAAITLRDPLLLPVGVDISLVIQCPSGPQTLTVRTATANTTTLNITMGVYPTDAPAFAQFTLSQATIGLIKPFRVIGIERDTSNNDLFTITALELNTNRFGDTDNYVGVSNISYAQTYLSTGTNVFAPTGGISSPVAGSYPSVPVTPTISNISSGGSHQTLQQDGTITTRVAIELQMEPGLSKDAEVHYRRGNQDDWQLLRTSNRRAYIQNAQVGAVYQIKACATRGTKRGTFSPVSTHTVGGLTTAGTAPSGWGGYAGFEQITLKGNKSSDKNFATFNVYACATTGGTYVLIDTIQTTNYVRRPPTGDLYQFYKVSTVNRSGVESALTAAIGTLVPNATVPAASVTDAMTLSTAQTVSGVKTFTDVNVTLGDNSDPTKKMKFDASGVTTATVRTATMPDASGTLVLHSNVQTLTNKSLDGLTNTFTNLDLTMLSGSALLQPVKVISLTNVVIATGGLLTIDGIVLGATDRVLLAGQTLPAENGVYIVAAGAWTRATDANAVQNAAVATVAVRRGTVYAGTKWETSLPGNGVVGTTAMAWFRTLRSDTLFTSVASGAVPLSGGGTTNFLRADGTWAVPPISGSVAWSGITGTPTTISGYGITDGVTLTGTQTLTNKTFDVATNVLTNFDMTILNSTGFLQSARMASTSNIVVATGGLTAVDSVTPAVGDRILLVGQTIPAENGVYIAASGAWARASDDAGVGNATAAVICIRRGTLYQGTQWATSFGGAGVVGTTAMNWFRVLRTDTTFTSTLGGAVPLSGGGTTNFLRADGTWAVPPVSGSVAWSVITGTPTTIAGYGITDGVTAAAAAAAYQPKTTILTNTTASYSTAEQTKLAGIAAGATANSADSFLLARANHTGTQAWSTITGTPTTIAGYGITDGVTITGTQTLTNKSLDGTTNILTNLDLTMMVGTGLIQPVKVISLANVVISTGGLLTIDSFVTATGDRVLLAGQTLPAENGIYVVAAGAWTRATDANTVNNLTGANVMVRRGTINQGSQWATSFGGASVVGTTAMNWYRDLRSDNGMDLVSTQTVGGDKTFTGIHAVLDGKFFLQDDIDPTKQAQFQLSGLTTGTTFTYTMLPLNGTIVLDTQTSPNLFSTTAAQSIGLGNGATASGVTKGFTLGMNGVSGSITNFTFGSAISGALGLATFNSPSFIMMGDFFKKQALPQTVTAAATLTNAQVQSGIIIYNGVAANLTMPLGTTLDALAMAVNTGIEFSIINTGSGTATVVTNTGTTLVGGVTTVIGASSRWVIRKLATSSYNVYRLA